MLIMTTKNSKQQLFEMMKKVNPDFILKEQEERSSYDSKIYDDIKVLLGNKETLSDSDIQQIAQSHGVGAEEVVQTLDYVKKEKEDQEPDVPSSSQEAEEVNDFFRFLDANPQKGSRATVQYMSSLDRYLAKPKTNPMVGRFIKLTEYTIEWGKSYKDKVAQRNPDWKLQQRKGDYTKMEGGYGDVMERDSRGDEVLPISPDGMFSIVLVLDESGNVVDKVTSRELKEKYTESFPPSFFKPRSSSGSGVDFRPLKLYGINRIAAGGKEWVNPKLKPPFDKYRQYFTDINKTLNESSDKSKALKDAEWVLRDYFKWFNPQELKVYDDPDGERHSVTYVLDVPKAEYTENLIDDLKYTYEGDSHGVEGNPGGWVHHGSVSDQPKDMGDFYRIHIFQESILDI
jgi:hypothetical protein